MAASWCWSSSAIRALQTGVSQITGTGAAGNINVQDLDVQQRRKAENDSRADQLVHNVLETTTARHADQPKTWPSSLPPKVEIFHLLLSLIPTLKKEDEENSVNTLDNTTLK